MHAERGALALVQPGQHEALGVLAQAVETLAKLWKDFHDSLGTGLGTLFRRCRPVRQRGTHPADEVEDVSRVVHGSHFRHRKKETSST